MRAPAFLLLDIGNTRAKWATASERGPIRPGGEIATEEIDEPKLLLLAKQHSTSLVCCACVVPRLLPQLRRAFGRRLHLVTGRSPALGFSFAYPKPDELGADRLAAAVAAHAEGRSPVIVISAGTATAFSVLDKKGNFCGGVIAPGLETQLHSLVARAAKLQTVPLHAPRRVLGKSTAEAIRSGVMLNFLGGVKEIVQRLEAELSPPRPRLLLTGGHAHHLAGKLDRPATLRPLLVFEGLRIMAVRLSTSVS